MATATSTVKEWEEPEQTRVSGRPPGPDVTVSHVGRGETRRQDIRAAHPLYKSGTVPGVPRASGVGMRITQESRVEPTYQDVPDYKIEREQDRYHLRIIDPKVEPRPGMDYRSSTLPPVRSRTPDFPSTHSKRSFLKLSALEPRRSRTIKTITPNDYLTQSLERHHRIYMSPLRENLRVDEKDVTQPWNAADRPGPKKRSPLLDLTSSKNIKATSATWQFSPRTVVDVNVPKKQPSPEPVKVYRPAAPFPQLYVPVTYELTEKHESNVQYERKGRREPDWGRLDDQYGSTLIKIKDENIHKPARSIMKQRFVRDYDVVDKSARATKPRYRVVEEPKKLVETTDTIEETKRVEEIERKVTSGDRRRVRGNIREGTEGGRRGTHRSGYNKSHSSKEFYGPDDEFRRMNLAGTQSGPIVEYPPTLPRSEASYSDRQSVKRGLRRDYDTDERQTSRSRREWALQPRVYDDSWFVDRNYDGLSKLEREFRETSLAPLPTEQNLNKREFREKLLPGGFETMEHQVKAEAGSRGPNNRFSESKQQVQYKREQLID